MVSEAKYSNALGDLRGVLARFKPGQKTYDEIVSTREQVFAKYRPIFSPEHVPSLTKDEFIDDPATGIAAWTNAFTFGQVHWREDSESGLRIDLSRNGVRRERSTRWIASLNLRSLTPHFSLDD